VYHEQRYITNSRNPRERDVRGRTNAPDVVPAIPSLASRPDDDEKIAVYSVNELMTSLASAPRSDLE
jgi:hypothetical protein